METLSYTYVRNHLAEVTDKVCNDHNPILVTRQGAPPVVVLSWEDYRSMEETAYLMRSPANASRLLDSIAAARRGELTEHELIEE
jgi:antitoxin YefM